ncbi:hypothetical protein [Candidatus Neptunochlamydia vexilliferae]|nr:hypothetical protein [Candidatus Neptunochlamydia vexilliferae]
MEFPKISALDLSLSKQSPVEKIGAMQRSLKVGMLMKEKPILKLVWV